MPINLPLPKLLKRRSSPPRYLQTRHELIQPDNNKKHTRKEWVISRGLCYYRLFSLETIPLLKRQDALMRQLLQWSPISNFDSYLVWQGDYVQAWIWSQTLVQSAQAELTLKKALMVLPETVLHAKPKSTNNTRTECIQANIDGYEGQIWEHGLLQGSHWWSSLPTLAQWNHFLRLHGCPSTDMLPILLEKESLLAKPWGKISSGSLQILQQERLWVTLGFSVFIAITSWQVVQYYKWQKNLNDLENQLEQLQASAYPILTARTQAIADKKIIEQLTKLKQFPEQLLLLKTVLEKLPPKANLVSWSYQTDKLSFIVEAPFIDPRFYIQTYQNLSFFTEVQSSVDTQKNQITVQMQVLPEKMIP